jgi:pyruvate/2-oxoacid:ferredoxin oxidoreductase alpha subunit
MTYIPEIDDPLMLLGLLQYYDTSSPTLAVEAKYSENVFYAQNGTVKTEWYGEKTEDEVPETPIEMDEFRETAANVINEVTEAIQTEYPELQPKKEFLEECENAAVLYGESYYNLESRIEDMLRRQFISKNPEIVEVIP